MQHTCPLCHAREMLTAMGGADGRRHFLCAHCWLISADGCARLTRDDEAAHYRLHENSIHQTGYVAFLNRLLDPMQAYLEPGMRCLDFGCGPGPTLSQLVRNRRIACDDYDPIFRDVPLSPPYDAIFATECLEHFHAPARELGRLAELLRPGGLLGIMTETWTDLDAFGRWYYTRDPTHVAFYHARTFEFIGTQFGFSIEHTDGRRVHILRQIGTEAAG